MAGHSKWANIKHRKERADLKKGKIFSRVTKEIISSVKQGGADPKSNPRLRAAVEKARLVNLPTENIERNIKKASSADQADFSYVTYELYGYGGIGIVVEIMTDNKNRIASEIRIATNKRGGSIANPGAVLFNFEKKAVLKIHKEHIQEDALFLAAGEAGAEDFEVGEEEFTILAAPDQLFLVKAKFDQMGIVVTEAELEFVPKTYVECDEENGKANLALIEWLENLDDVDAVYHNMK